MNKPLDLSIVTLFPDLYEPFFTTSLIGRARERAIIKTHIANLFSFCAPKERIDSPSYGPGAGMLIKPPIVQKAIESQEHETGHQAYKIFFSPQGKKLDQNLVKTITHEWQQKKHLMCICARYEGMDERVEQYYADQVISIGDYVLMGGDLPAMVLIESILRYIPGVIGKQESVIKDSFSGPLVDYPEYTDPLVWQGVTVPDIIRSGNHQKIEEFRQQEALKKTVSQHFGWFRGSDVDTKLALQARRVAPAHYAALMHDNVQLKDGRIGTSSVTSIDIHDIARSATTFGLAGYFIVSPLKDQQKIVSTLLEFWRTDGKQYNYSRSQSLECVQQNQSLDEVITHIQVTTGKQPLIIGTSAKEHVGVKMITYNDQAEVWKHQRPVLFVFGTACGLAQQVLNRCDYLLPPIRGLSDFNHLSVRSAVGIILDRWLGLNPNT